MTKHGISASDWVGARGEKWLGTLDAMEAMLAPIDEPLAAVLRGVGSGVAAGARIADIGCGGGGGTLALRGRWPHEVEVHGFDISPSLVEAAQARGRDEGVSFEVADVSRFVPARPYTHLVSRFGVMFFDEPAVAFANLARWLVPGGGLAFAVWGAAAENAWAAEVRDVVAEVVELPRTPPDAPGPFRYGDPAKLVELLEAAGLRDVATEHWRGALPLGGVTSTAAEAASFALASFASFAELLAKADDDARRAVHERLAARFARHRRDGAIELEASVHFVAGVAR